MRIRAIVGSPLGGQGESGFGIPATLLFGESASVGVVADVSELGVALESLVGVSAAVEDIAISLDPVVLVEATIEVGLVLEAPPSVGVAAAVTDLAAEVSSVVGVFAEAGTFTDVDASLAVSSAVNDLGVGVTSNPGVQGAVDVVIPDFAAATVGVAAAVNDLALSLDPVVGVQAAVNDLAGEVSSSPGVQAAVNDFAAEVASSVGGASSVDVGLEAAPAPTIGVQADALNLTLSGVDVSVAGSSTVPQIDVVIDEVTGGVDATDSGPNALNGSVLGSPSSISSPWANFNGAVDLDGDLDGVDFGSSTLLGFVTSTPATLEFKVRVDAAPAAGRNPLLVGRMDPNSGASAANFGLVVYLADDMRVAVRWNQASGLTRTVFISPALVVGQLHDVAVSYDGSSMFIYLDGTLRNTQASPTFAALNANHKFRAGVQDRNPETNPLNSFVGVLDEIRFSSVARYTGSSYTVATVPFVSDGSTVALWHLDQVGVTRVPGVEVEASLDVSLEAAPAPMIGVQAAVNDLAGEVFSSVGVQAAVNDLAGEVFSSVGVQAAVNDLAGEVSSSVGVQADAVGVGVSGVDATLGASSVADVAFPITVSANVANGEAVVTFRELFDTAGDTTWTAPPTVTTVTVEAWGGGGGGGSANVNGGGGGGGGEYRKGNATVVPGNNYTVTVGAGGAVGAAGGDSSFDATQVVAKGGGAGGDGSVGNQGAGGAGGTGGTGATANFNGGAGGGGAAVQTSGGGGGGGAGDNGAGGAGASNRTAGAAGNGTLQAGGVGGTGAGATEVATAGSVPGGGGGGASTAQARAAGARGRVYLTYTRTFS